MSGDDVPRCPGCSSSLCEDCRGPLTVERAHAEAAHAWEELGHEMRHGTHGEWLAARRRVDTADRAVLVAALADAQAVVDLDAMCGAR